MARFLADNPPIDPKARRAVRQPVSLLAFAQAMRAENATFRGRIERYEARHGPLSDALLCVAAQANFTCWFEASFPSNLIAACQAIRDGVANAITLCQQIDPRRWRTLHTFVVATQRWLGISPPLPEPLEPAQIERLIALLGQPTPLRQALARIYLWTLISHLRHYVSLGQLCAEGALVQGSYADYGAWYLDEQGQRYGDPHRAQEFLAMQRGRVRQAPQHLLEEVETLQAQLCRGLPETTRPACVQRFPRYQEIRMASIGALRWRGYLPTDTVPRQSWEALFARASNALESWIRGGTPADRLAEDIHQALGAPGPERSDLVRIFLMQPPEEGGFYAWLLSEAAEHGRSPDAAFADQNAF